MKTLRYFALVLLTAVSISLPFAPAVVFAEAAATNKSLDSIPHVDDPALKSSNCTNINKCTLVTNFLQPLVDFLAAFVGVAIVTGIIYGGIQYGSSGGDPQKVANGKKWIKNAIIALIIYLFFLSFMKFVLLPGALD